MNGTLRIPALAGLAAIILSFGTLSLPAAANGCMGFEETGTSGDPKLVESVSDLASLGASNCLGSVYYFKQTTDISLTGSWTPYAFDFTANYDGGGYAIRYLGVSTSGSAGMFSTISGGSVSNLRLEAERVVSSGGHAGVLAGEIKNGSTISKIDIQADLVIGAMQTGGLVGMTSGARSSISEVSVVGQIESADNVGGIVGQAELDSAGLTDVSFAGSVIGIGNYAAGIVGYALGTNIENAYSVGTVTGDVSMRGGIAGAGYSNTVVRNSFFLTGTVDANSNVGGDETAIEVMTDKPAYFSASWSIGDSLDVLRSGSANETWFIGPGVNGGFPTLVWAYEAGAYPCDPGTFSVNGQQPCLSAPIGTFVDTSEATEATLCPIGYFNPNQGSMVCYTADEGHFVAFEGQSEQIECPVGEYQPDEGQVECLLAPQGSFVANTGQAEPVLCPPGRYQDRTGQMSCIHAQPGFYVALEGATAQIECEPGTTSDIGAISCFQLSSSTGYSGPLVSAPSVVGAAGEKVTISGSNLDMVTTISVAGFTAAASCDATSCSFELPQELSAGTHDLVLIGSHGSLTISSAVNISGTLVVSASVPAWTKRVSATEIKVYAKDLVGAGKVQFLVDGNEIAWVNAIDESDPKLSVAKGFSYLVRSVQLNPGKNLFEIQLDGERVFRATYVPKS